jgi:4'-phosphopantetheinyl transferase
VSKALTDHNEAQKTRALQIRALHWPDLPDSAIARAERIVSVQEQKKASNYTNQIQRIRYIASRALLRTLSAEYLDLDAATLALGYGGNGKPYWANIKDRLHFNISHSGSWIVLAFSSHFPVGIDIQSRTGRASRDSLALATRFFHPSEQDSLRRAEADQRETLFFDIWSGKEAVIKAFGEGVHGGLRKFSVTPAPEAGQWQAIDTAAFSKSAKISLLRKLEIDEMDGYAGAVCLAGADGKPVMNTRIIKDISRLF